MKRSNPRSFIKMKSDFENAKRMRDFANKYGEVVFLFKDGYWATRSALTRDPNKSIGVYEPNASRSNPELLIHGMSNPPRMRRRNSPIGPRHMAQLRKAFKALPFGLTRNDLVDIYYDHKKGSHSHLAANPRGGRITMRVRRKSRGRRNPPKVKIGRHRYYFISLMRKFGKAKAKSMWRKHYRRGANPSRRSSRGHRRLTHRRNPPGKLMLPYRGKGWHGESGRHAGARAKGCRRLCGSRKR